MYGKLSGVGLVVAAIILAEAHVGIAQSDGNPHNWDRNRRCDGIDYDPPCSICEGYGGIPHGDENDQIKLTTCTPLKPASEIDPATVKPVQWGTVWTLPQAHEILIGKKNDPFCFVTFPGPDSKGKMCYVQQSGAKYYDMEKTKAFKEVLKVKTITGNITSTVVHQGDNFWISNQLPLGVHQCACVHIREGGTGHTPVYPIQYNWIDNLSFLGREKLAIEYMDVTLDVDHWVYGPHHVWTRTEDGNIVRMYQPFNGLQVYPTGVAQGKVDPEIFKEIPPPHCKKGGALIRSGCDDNGYPVDKKMERIKVRLGDEVRAKTKVPRHDYKGMDFGHMSQVLNNWLNMSSTSGMSAKVKACEQWDVEEIQKLQSLLFMLREVQFDDIYQSTTDNRRLQFDVLNDISSSWTELNKLAAEHKNPMMKRMRRDGHCHEAVMWFVHHLTQEMKQFLQQFDVTIPLLSHARHECNASQDTVEGRICSAYQKQVTCSDCHSNVLPKKTLYH